MGRRGEGALLANRLQVRADERRSRRLEMQRKQQQAQQASKAAAAAAEALQAAREAAARRERAAEVRAEREATERKRELLVYRAKQARQPSAPPLLLHSHLRADPPPPSLPSLARPRGLSPRTREPRTSPWPLCHAATQAQLAGLHAQRALVVHRGWLPWRALVRGEGFKPRGPSLPATPNLLS